MLRKLSILLWLLVLVVVVAAAIATVVYISQEAAKPPVKSIPTFPLLVEGDEVFWRDDQVTLVTDGTQVGFRIESGMVFSPFGAVLDKSLNWAPLEETRFSFDGGSCTHEPMRWHCTPEGAQ